MDLTGDDRAIIYGALRWMADKLRSDEREKALALWAAKGTQALHDQRPVSGEQYLRDAPFKRYALRRTKTAESP